MKAMVKGINSNGEKFGYIVDDIINVVYSNDYILLIMKNGTSASYANTNSEGYKYIITIM